MVTIKLQQNVPHQIGLLLSVGKAIAFKSGGKYRYTVTITTTHLPFCFCLFTSNNL